MVVDLWLIFKFTSYEKQDAGKPIQPALQGKSLYMQVINGIDPFFHTQLLTHRNSFPIYHVSLTVHEKRLAPKFLENLQHHLLHHLYYACLH